MKVDLNLLPEEHRPKRWALPLTVGLIIVILAVGYYGFGLFGKSADAHSQLEQLQSELNSVNAEIQKVINESPIAEYETQIAESQAEVDRLKAMEKDYAKHVAQRIYWKPVLQAVREEAPHDVTLTSFEQNDNTLTLEGELGGDVENAVIIVEYAKNLEDRGIFTRSPAFEIGSEERPVGEGEDSKTVEVFVFTMLLEVRRGG